MCVCSNVSVCVCVLVGQSVCLICKCVCVCVCLRGSPVYCAASSDGRHVLIFCCPKDLSRAATAAAVRPPEGTRKGSMGRRACVRYNT